MARRPLASSGLYKNYVIEQAWLFVAVDQDGNEGLTGFHGPTGWMPMVACDKERYDSLLPIARRMVSETAGLTIKVYTFDSPRVLVEEIKS